MAKAKMAFLASYKLFMHWVKLYYPKMVLDWEPVKTPDEATDEHLAHFQLIQYLKRGSGPPF